jgi:benzoate/toluate 1,2-dioxygenase subunit alpha
MSWLSQRAVDPAAIAELAPEDRMHRLTYTDPELFDLEMDRVFASTWVYAGHESQVPNPGDFITTQIGLQPVIFTRDGSGQIQVLFNRCMHRGAVVCREEHGSSSYFRCLYHGWTYGSDGRLLQVPFGGGYGDNFDTGSLGLQRVPNVASYRGFVFVCLKPEVEPFETYLGRAKDYMDMVVDIAPEGEIEVSRGVCKYAYRANWKFHLENWADNYHPPFTHEAAFQRTDLKRGKVTFRADQGAQNADLGHGHSMIDWSRGEDGPRALRFKVDDTHRAAIERRLGPDRAKRVLTQSNMNLNIFPNLLFRTENTYFLVIRPVRVDYTEIYTYGYRLKGADEAENDRWMQLVSSAASMTQSDDLEAFERIQEGLRVTAAPWVLFDRGLQREWVEPSGEVRGLGGDEVGHRGQHREWRRLMMAEQRRCCRGADCLGPRAEAVVVAA